MNPDKAEPIDDSSNEINFYEETVALRVPKMIRGIINAVIVCFASIGSIFYLQTSKPFFSTYANMVFGMMGVYDAITLVFIFICMYLGRWGDPAPREDAFNEGNSIQKEDQTADYLKHEDYMDDDLPDVPFFQDIAQEHIPEMNSSYEASSVTTKKFVAVASSHRGSKCFDEDDLPD